MKRFASIDFLRGCAIFGMVLLHVVSDTLDLGYLVDTLEEQPLINTAALALLPYLGGLAGLFLLVSAIANMVSMQKRLQAGRSVTDLVVRQVLGGVALIVFAFLTESTLGYHGALGVFFRNLHRPAAPNYMGIILKRGFLVETIHTIAWCVLVNGIVQGIVSRKGRWRSVRYQVKVYAVLAILVIALTQPVWHLVQVSVGSNGYPWDMTTGSGIFLPNILTSGTTPVDLLIGFFVNPLAAPVEPLFPYLSISFLGSIIGIVLAQSPDTVPRRFPKRMMLLGLAMFITGSVGIIWFLVSIANGSEGIHGAISMYLRISFHRDWYNNPNFPATFTFPFAWLWQFLSLNGLSIILTMFAVRLIEFRGRGATFAGQTTFMRRFGYIAFTNYNNQWYYAILLFLVGVVVAGFGLETLVYPRFESADAFNPYQRMGWAPTLLFTAMVVVFYHGIMRLWERVGYIGSLEWLIVSIVYWSLPHKKSGGIEKPNRHWWEKGKLDVSRTFYDADWVNIVRDDEIDHAALEDSKLALKVTLIALLSVIFMPAVFATLKVAREAQETEGMNRYNRAAKTLSIFGICLMIGALIPLCFITPRIL